jgi:epoxyqueuosine reductase
MGYLEAERSRRRRAAPRQILAECRSILALGVRYLPPPAGQALQPGKGRVAAYAAGADYHEVLLPRLQALVEFLEGETGSPVPNRYYTDTGPVLERDLAQRAGLGWAGKNTCLIHPKKGSYFLLAEILLGIELESSGSTAPDYDLCGSCTRCLDACPTGCILPDRTIDARRCISYLTIELKGAIPGEMRTQMGSWVFGCDVCQAVCPWNLRFASQAEQDVIPELRPAAERLQVDLTAELALSSSDFNLRFKGTPLKRAKRRGYLRNVAVALGNLADPDTIPALRQSLLAEPEPMVRGHAAWALGQMKTPAARQALDEALKIEMDPAVRREIEQALSQPDG